MKASPIRLLGFALLATAPVQAQTYTNLIRQVQFPGGSEYDMPVENNYDPNDPTRSLMPIDPGGARFELWTMRASGATLTNILLSSTYVATYMPVATVAITSEDQTSELPRTRADRPFRVMVNVIGLLSGATVPDASKSVNFYHHVQSYGEGGVGTNIDRTQAVQLSGNSLTTVDDHPFNYAIHSVPSADLTKARGEERFSVYSLADVDSGAPISELAGQTIQIWPVADGAIAGLTQGQNIKFRLPQLTLTLNDLYPSSTTYVQAYKGPAVLGTVGTVVPGSALVLNESVPQNRILMVDNYDEAVSEDGQWTFELLTSTPFGIDRLGHVTFNINRSLDFRGSSTTIE